MTDFFKSVFEFLKPDLKIALGALSVLYLLFLTLPQDLEPIVLVSEHRVWVHLAGLLSVSYLFVSLLRWLFGKWKELKSKCDQKKYLETLDGEEKKIFKLFIIQERKTVPFNYNEGAVLHLANLGFIYMPTELSKRGSMMRFDYTIQPWVWAYLNKKKNLLS